MLQKRTTMAFGGSRAKGAAILGGIGVDEGQETSLAGTNAPICWTDA
jgi:hypothetical protein